MADIGVTRKDLETFLPNLRTVRAFETILQSPSSVAGLQAQIDLINSQISDINIEIDNLTTAIENATNYGTY